MTTSDVLSASARQVMIDIFRNAEQQPRAEHADDNQASNVRGWFQPIFRAASADDTATSPASPAPSTASRAPSVPASPAGKTPAPAKRVTW